MTDLEKLLTPADVADLLSITERTLTDWRADPDHPLEWVKVGRWPRYRPSALVAFLEHATQSPGR